MMVESLAASSMPAKPTPYLEASSASRLQLRRVGHITVLRVVAGRDQAHGLVPLVVGFLGEGHLQPFSSQFLVRAVISHGQPVIEGQHDGLAVREVGGITIEWIDGDLVPDRAIEGRSSPTGVSQAYRAVILAGGIVDIDDGTLTGRQGTHRIRQQGRRWPGAYQA